MKLDRSVVNAMRYVLEDLIPPALRDSLLFYPLMKIVFGRNARRFADFRQDLLGMSKADYSEYYSTMVPVMGETDLNQGCIDAILADAAGASVLDVGCGRGYLVRRLVEAHPDKRIAGIDIAPPPSTPAAEFVSGWVEDLPFPDGAFDTVVCTHTLEHILDLEGAMAELRRVAARRVIAVVPREREYRYSFNFHVNFFPYEHSFLNRIRPDRQFQCRTISGDIYYVEDRDAAPAGGGAEIAAEGS
jgi:SAM-dependent methyltransferase